MSWGTGSWGLGAFGVGSLSISYARAYDTNTVLVELTNTVMARAPYRAGDALNPGVWTVTDTVTGDVFTVLSTEVLSGGTIVLVHLLESLGPFSNLHEVSAPTLLDETGALIEDPTSFEFYGLRAAASIQAKQDNVLVDLANVGGLQITSAGDYAEQIGGAIVRKIIQRRLTTIPGGFFFLNDFGLGINIKQPMTIAGLVALKAQIELQMRAEPEVESAQATLTLNTAGYVLGVLKVKLRAGTDVEDIPISSVVQF